MSSTLLLGLIFAWPILALIVHLLIPIESDIPRQHSQTFFTLVWLIMAVGLMTVSYTIDVVHVGNWPAPFGIALVNDALSRTMLCVFAIVTFCINLFSYQDIGLARKRQGFYAGYWLLMIGLSGALFTADIFNLYVWFEVILVSAFILLACAPQPKTKAMIQYAIMNISGTLLMLLAVAMIYGAFGTLNYAQIAQVLRLSSNDWTLPILCFLLFAIGLKGAVFPLYFWLPKAYPKTSTSSTMLLSSLVTKVVMVVLLRLASLWPPLHDTFLSNTLVGVALATMFFGVMGAASQFRFKNILAFHVVSQLGYILLAILLPPPAAIIAAAYFIIHNVFVKTHLFMVAGQLEQHTGTDDFKKLGHLLQQHKFLSVCFFLSALSLAGFPPLSGFWAKLLLLEAALKAHFYGSVIIAIIVSLFTLYSMIKIWRYVFCEKPQVLANQPSKRPLAISPYSYLALSLLLIIPIVMGLWPDGILGILKPLAHQLSQPNQYIQLVLGQHA